MNFVIFLQSLLVEPLDLPTIISQMKFLQIMAGVFGK